MARVIGLWKKTGDTLEPAISGGSSLLLRGSNRFINFSSDTGEDGYGIRDNAGSIEFKDSSGSWVAFSSISGGGSVDESADYTWTGEHDFTGATVLGFSDVAFSGDYTDLTNKPDLSALNDTVVEANLAAFPATGSSDSVYIAEDTGYMYRWNGSGYTQLTDQTAIWGQIGGTLSNQTDLQTALNGKATSAQGALADSALQPGDIGSDVQAYNADLEAIASLTSAADRGIYYTGAGTASLFTLTSAARSILDDTSTTNIRTTLGVGTGQSPQFTALNIGHASDTTLARVAAGRLSVEGVEIATESNTLTLVNKTLTAPTITGVANVEDLDYEVSYSTPSALGSLGSTEVIDWSSATNFTGTLDQDCTITHSNEVSGQKITIALTGEFTPTFSDIDTWGGGTAPGAIGASETLIVTAIRLGTTVHGSFELFS